MQIIVKSSYKHINSALGNWDTPVGKLVKNRAHYDQLCREQGMISYEQAQELAEKNKNGKEYKMSNEARQIIDSCKFYKDKKGNVNLKERPKLVEKMVKHGTIKDSSQYLKYLPAAYQPKGGFTNGT